MTFRRPSRFRLGTLLVLLVAARAAAAPDPEEGLPLLRVYPRAEYSAQPHFWSGFLHRGNGLLYFGNHLGLLEFDGVHWRALVSTLGYCRTIAEGPQGEIFAADDDDLGYFPAPDTGTPQWIRLIDRVPAALRPLGRIRSIVCWRGAMWFAGERAVLRWENGKLETWSFPAAQPSRLFAVGDRLWLHRHDEGLREFTGGKFGSPFAPALAREEPLLVSTAPGGARLVLASGRLVLLARDGTLTPWPAGAEASSVAGPFTAALMLARGELAVATADGQLAILGRDGRLLARYSRASGLPHATLLSLTEDAVGQLWLGTDNGPVRLDWRARATCFDARSGIGPTRVQQILRHDGVFYLLNADGLFHLVPASRRGEPARFEPDRRIAGLDHPDWLLSHPSGLLVGARDGVYRLATDHAERLFAVAGGVVTVIRSRSEPARLFVGTAHGILTGRLVDDHWQSDGAVDGFDAELADLVAEPDGTLWATTISKGVFRLRASTSGWAHPEVRRYTVADGLPENHGAIYAWPSSLGVHIDTAQGMYRYDAARDRMAFDAALVAFDSRQVVINPLAGGGPGELWANGILMTREIPYPLVHFHRRADGGFDLQRAPPAIHAFFAPGGAYRIYPEPDRGLVWACGERGLIRVETAAYNAASDLPAPIFTRLDAEGAARVVPLAGVAAAAPVALHFSREPLAVSYASRTFHDPALERFQVRLLGFNDAWSAPTEKTEAIYTNLEGGPFRFQVRTLGPDGAVSAPAELAFTVAPPWFRTRGARAAYVLLGLLGVGGFIRWRLSAARREQARLESLVRQRTVELAAARDEAEAASRAKSAFLAHMSHELRTPLNGIIGYTQVLQKDDGLGPRHRERVDIVHASGQHLLRMINEVLDFSKIEAGKIERRDAPFHFEQLLRELAVAHETAAAARGLAFGVTLPSDLPAYVVGDAQKLRQILDNLLSNAVKFTARGRVALRVSAAGAERWRFAVEDTGVGLSAEDVTRLFQPFEQARHNRPGEPGTGLGLAITQRLAQLLGGDIAVTSAPGEGSCFTFSLPLPATTAPGTEAKPAAAPVGYEDPRKKILIVDDHPVNRSLLADLLTPLGFEVAEFASGEDVLAASAAALRADLAFVDVKMTGLDGLELVQRLRERPDTAALPVVFTSASVLTFDRAAAERLGCPEFLPKPFAVGHLITVISRTLPIVWRTALPAAGNACAMSGAPLPAGLAEALRNAAESGDIAALRQMLATARATHPHHPLLAQVDAAAAAYQLERIRQLLSRS